MARPYLPSYLSLMLALGLTFSAQNLMADDLQQAASSPLSGIAFDDHPVILPITESFQTAMHDVANDLGKHCGGTEAYGWRLLQTEQQRVNNAFNSAVSKLSELGYTLIPQTPHSATKEVTVFTAEKANKNILIMWSAGDLGLVLLMCDAQNGTAANATDVLPDLVAEAPVEEVKKPIVKKHVEKTKPVTKHKEKAKPVVPTKKTAKLMKPEPLTPEVKAMLDSLPEATTPNDNLAIPASTPDAIIVPAPEPKTAVPLAPPAPAEAPMNIPTPPPAPLLDTTPAQQ